MGDLAFVGEYGWRLGSKTYAWWNELDNVPVMLPQVRRGAGDGLAVVWLIGGLACHP